jgi:PBSX family phage terminase large subunit
MSQLHPKQKEAAADTHRFRVLNWGRKSGKTELVIEELIGYAVVPSPYHQKPPKITYIGETRKEAQRIAWDRAKQRTKPIWFKEPNESRLELFIRVQKQKDGDPEYSTIFFDGWENIGALIGEEFDFMALDEVAKFRNFWAGWQNVLRPTLTPRKGASLFISRPQGFNHWYDLCNVQTKNTNFKTFYATAYDNPFIAKEEIDEARVDLGEVRFAQEYLGEFRKMEGLVYQDFSRSVHLFDDQTPRSKNFVEVIAGVDFGFTNPSCILRIEHDTDNHYWVTAEWYKTKVITKDIIEQIQTMGGITRVYPDPAEPDRILELQNAGISTADVSKDIEAGIASVQALFREKRLHIHISCLNLIGELESYRYPDKRPDQNEYERPIKEKDHACDALRYPLHMQQPVEDDISQEFSLYAASYG